MRAPEPPRQFFRHEYGRLVAVLTRRVGAQHLEAIEDAVQSALMKAVESWTARGKPDNPSAWLYRVARNELLGELRRRAGRRRLLERNAGDIIGDPGEVPEVRLAGEMQDDLLSMLFVCCDGALPEESQMALALKVLCGFSVPEIALRLFTSEANIYKRLSRARSRLRKTPPRPDELSAGLYAARLPSVNKSLYLLFTEGYLSSNATAAIRRELCEEAIRLASILGDHPVGATPETFALLALMQLHMARMDTRQDRSGGLLLLEEQDRSRWDRDRIQAGLRYLERSARGDSFTRYHAEAGIAAEHCLAPSFQETRWDRVAECYELLESIAPSAIHRMNRAVAVAEWRGPAAGLSLLKDFAPPAWLRSSYLWAAVLADLHRRCGDTEAAGRYREEALKAAPTPAVAALLKRRLENSGAGCAP
ncbi:sigma-70 family RNA polymerase sigma factor [Pelagibius sp. CAU 1746]|uniref:RNA polymerase sigma factor n=1 Tax=Pelagibius sp. CAU 1746 TaxID=3140370 RepID=UPI00325B3629